MSCLDRLDPPWVADVRRKSCFCRHVKQAPSRGHECIWGNGVKDLCDLASGRRTRSVLFLVVRLGLIAGGAIALAACDDEPAVVATTQAPAAAPAVAPATSLVSAAPAPT